jgi:hypothetical protein
MFRDRGGWVGGLGEIGEARPCLISNHLHG